MPLPSDPETESMPGVLFMSGWPCNMPLSVRSFGSSSIGKKPFRASAAYCIGQAWPFERISRSRSPQPGSSGRSLISSKYSTLSISAIDMHGPGCPSPDACTISTTSIRRRFAIRYSSPVFILTASRLT